MTDTKKAYPTDEAIAAVMAGRKLNRISAVQFLRRHAAKSASAAQPKAAVESKPKAAKRKAVKRYDKAPITEELREKLDRLVRATAGKDAVENRLKLCHSPKYHRYEFWGCASGNVVNLSIDGLKAHLMPQDSNTVKGWKKTLREREKAAEAKIAAAKAEAKKA
jgi:outer membrane translocation and assembly module TamA